MTSQQRGPSRRARGVLGLAALLGLGALVGVFFCTPQRQVPVVEPPPPPPAALVDGEADTKAPRRTPEPAGPEPEPVIDEVTVEKRELCSGEENLVMVKAHTENGTDDQLHYTIGGVAGQRVPLRMYLPDDGPPVPRTVTVFGRGNVAKTVELPYIRVKDCGKQPVLVVGHRVRANRPNEFDFHARLLHPPPKVAITRFEWDFGDGTSSVSTEPVAVHSYAERPQRSHHSSYLVSVVAVGSDGKKYRGRDALQLLNRAYQVRAERGVILLEAELNPRFPVLGPDGIVRQRVRLRHHAAGPVTVTRVMVERAYLDGAGATSLEPVTPLRALGTELIPPGSGYEFEIALDTEAEPDTLSIGYLMEGTGDGLPATGSFAVMRPPAPPTPEQHTPVHSRVQKAKILEARRLLQKPYVTDEELWELERRGAFQDLPEARGADDADPPPPPPRAGNEVKVPTPSSVSPAGAAPPPRPVAKQPQGPEKSESPAKP